MGFAPAASHRRRQGGSGWLEFAVSAVVIAVLAAVLLPALLAYQALAEKTAVDLTIMNLRTGLRLRIAELILAGREREVAGLAGANPVRWLEHPPERYLGEIDPPEGLGGIARGAWFFDRRRLELVYRVHHESWFAPAPGEAAAVRLRVAAEGVPTGNGALSGVALRVTRDYNGR